MLCRNLYDGDSGFWLFTCKLNRMMIWELLQETLKDKMMTLFRVLELPIISGGKSIHLFSLHATHRISASQVESNRIRAWAGSWIPWKNPVFFIFYEPPFVLIPKAQVFFPFQSNKRPLKFKNSLNAGRGKCPAVRVHSKTINRYFTNQSKCTYWFSAQWNGNRAHSQRPNFMVCYIKVKKSSKAVVESGGKLHYFNLFFRSLQGHDTVNRGDFNHLTLLVTCVFLDLSPSLGSDFLCFCQCMQVKCVERDYSSEHFSKFFFHLLKQRKREREIRTWYSF